MLGGYVYKKMDVEDMSDIELIGELQKCQREMQNRGIEEVSKDER